MEWIPVLIRDVVHQQSCVEYVDVPTAIYITDALVGYLCPREDVCEQELEIRGVNDHVPIDVATHRRNMNQRQMILIRAADGVRCIAEPVAVGSRVVAPVVAADVGSTDDVWSCGVVSTAVAGVVSVAEVAVVD